MRNQKGFSAVIVLVVLVVVAAVGFTGYYVWNKQHTKKAVVVVASSPATTKSSDTTTTKNYLVVKEWGVKGEVDKTVGVIYGFDSSDANKLTFSSSSLAALDGMCGFNAKGQVDSSHHGAYVGIFRYSSSDAATAEVDASGHTAKDVGTLVNGYYYVALPAQSSCSQTASDAAKTDADQAKVVAAAKTFFSTIQSAN